MNTKIIQTSIRMPERLKQQLKTIVHYKGRTLNALMLEIIETYVDKAKH